MILHVIQYLYIYYSSVILFFIVSYLIICVLICLGGNYNVKSHVNKTKDKKFKGCIQSLGLF